MERKNGTSFNFKKYYLWFIMIKEKHKEILMKDKNDNIKNTPTINITTTTNNNNNNNEDDIMMNDPFGLEEILDVSKISNEM